MLREDLGLAKNILRRLPINLKEGICIAIGRQVFKIRARVNSLLSEDNLS